MKKQNGFTLIEILVTVVVTAIGLLGLAGLQATALSFNSTAYQRSQATNLAYDIADRMRANVMAARANAYVVNDIRNNPPSGTTLAAIDLGEWRQALINTLPLGTGTINSPAANIISINVQWEDDREDDNNDGIPDQSFQMDTEI